MSSLSGVSDLLSPGDNSRGSMYLLGRPGSRPEVFSFEGKSSPFSTMSAPGSNFLTPRGAGGNGGGGCAPFSSPSGEGKSGLSKAHPFPHETFRGDDEDALRYSGSTDGNELRPDNGGVGADGGMGDGGKGGASRNGFKRIFSGVPSPSHFRRTMSFAAISNAATRVAVGAMTPIRRRRHRRSTSASVENIDSSGRDNRNSGGNGEGYGSSGESGRGRGVKNWHRRRGGKGDGRRLDRNAAEMTLGSDTNKTGVLSPEDSPPRTNILVAPSASDDVSGITNYMNAAGHGPTLGGGGGRSSSFNQARPFVGRTRGKRDERQQQQQQAANQRQTARAQQAKKSPAEKASGLTEWSWGPGAAMPKREPSSSVERGGANSRGEGPKSRSREDAPRDPSLEGRASWLKDTIPQVPEKSTPMPPLPLPPDRHAPTTSDANVSGSVELTPSPTLKALSTPSVQSPLRRRQQQQGVDFAADGGDRGRGGGSGELIEKLPARSTGVAVAGASPPPTTRRNTFFSAGSGRATHMFASSALGVRAARRARSASRDSIYFWKNQAAEPEVVISEPQSAPRDAEARNDRVTKGTASAPGENAVTLADSARVKVTASAVAAAAAAAAAETAVLAAAFKSDADRTRADSRPARTQNYHEDPKVSTSRIAVGDSERAAVPRRMEAIPAPGDNPVTAPASQTYPAGTLSTRNLTYNELGGDRRPASITNGAFMRNEKKLAPNLALARAGLRRVPSVKSALTVAEGKGSGCGDNDDGIYANGGAEVKDRTTIGVGNAQEDRRASARGRGGSYDDVEGKERRRMPSGCEVFDSPESYVSDGSAGSISGSSFGGPSSGTNDDLSVSGSSDDGSPSRAVALMERRAALVAASMRSSEPPAPPPPPLVKGMGWAGEGGAALSVSARQQHQPWNDRRQKQNSRQHRQHNDRQQQQQNDRQRQQKQQNDRQQQQKQQNDRQQQQKQQNNRQQQQQQNDRQRQQPQDDRQRQQKQQNDRQRQQAPQLAKAKELSLPSSSIDAGAAAAALSPSGGAGMPSAVDAIPPNTVRAAVAKFDAKKASDLGGSVGGGSVRLLGRGPRRIRAFGRKQLESSTDVARVVKNGSNIEVGASGGDREKAERGHRGRSSKAVDDLPPAEMGALGHSLSCALCGKVETPPPRKPVAFRRERGGEMEVEVEVKRCSRCRRGCCEACFEWLPVHCRGPNIIVPVCRDCSRSVDFENRWHDHLLAKASRQTENYGRHQRSPDGRPEKAFIHPLHRSASLDTVEGVSPESARSSPTVTPWWRGADKPISPAMAPQSQGLFQTVTLPIKTSPAVVQQERVLSMPRAVGAAGDTSRRRRADSGVLSTASWFGFSLAGGSSSVVKAFDAGRGGHGTGGMFSSLTSAFSPRGHEGAHPPTTSTALSRAVPDASIRRAIGARARREGGSWGAQGRVSPRPAASPRRISPSRAPPRRTTSPVHLQGRDPSDCPCGAAALYLEAVGHGHKPVATQPSASISVGDMGAAVNAVADVETSSKADVRTKREAHKMQRAKAYAHLLTRGQKALAYAEMQGKASEFLRERAALVPHPEAQTSPANNRPKEQASNLVAAAPSDGVRSLAQTSVEATAAAAAAMKGDRKGEQARASCQRPRREITSGRTGSTGPQSPSLSSSPTATTSTTMSVSPHVMAMIPSPINTRKRLPRNGSDRHQPAEGRVPSASLATEIAFAVAGDGPVLPKKPAAVPCGTATVEATAGAAAVALETRTSGRSCDIREPAGAPSPCPSLSPSHCPSLSPSPLTITPAPALTSGDAPPGISLPVKAVVARGAAEEEAEAMAAAAAAAVRGKQIWAEAERASRERERMDMMIKNSRRARAINSRNSKRMNNERQKQQQQRRLATDANDGNEDEHSDSSLDEETEANSSYSPHRLSGGEEPLDPQDSENAEWETGAGSVPGDSAGGRRKIVRGRRRLASPPPPPTSTLSPLPPLLRARHAAGFCESVGVGGRFAGEGGDLVESAVVNGGDERKDMRQLVKDREALFERMISGPGITATKFPRRGRPRTVVLTLSIPNSENANDVGNSGSDGYDSGDTTSCKDGDGGGGGVRGGNDERVNSGSCWGTVEDSASPASSRNMDGGGSGSSPPSEVRAQSSNRSLDSLMNLELVWNRQRGGRGSLTVGEVVDALVGPQSQVPQPVCEELRRKVAGESGARGGGSADGDVGRVGVRRGQEEKDGDTFVSLHTARRTLDLQFPTSAIRDRFLQAFETFAWETSTAAGVAGHRSAPEVLRHFPRKLAATQSGTSVGDTSYLNVTGSNTKG